MLKTESAIFCLVAFASDGRRVLNKAVKVMQKACQIEGVSSVYSVKARPDQPKTIHDILASENYLGLVAAVKITTDQGPTELLSSLENLWIEDEEIHMWRNFNAELLVYGCQSTMNPKMTLPYPELHLKAEYLIPASEVWGSYNHPVLEQNLFTLAKNYSNEKWGEFFAPGSTLVSDDS